MSKIHKVIITAEDLKGLEVYQCITCKVTKFIDGKPEKPVKCPKCEKLLWILNKEERKAKVKEVLMGIFPVIVE